MLDSLKAAMAETKVAMAETARRATFGLASGITLLVGLSFLTVAAWIVLERTADSLTAALVLGAAYTGLGLIFMAFALARRKRRPEPTDIVRSDIVRSKKPPSAENVFARMTTAFFEGLGAGLVAKDEFASRRRSKRDDPDRR